MREKSPDAQTKLSCCEKNVDMTLSKGAATNTMATTNIASPSNHSPATNI